MMSCIYKCKAVLVGVSTSFPFWLLVAPSTPCDSILHAGKYWFNYLFWPYYAVCIASEGFPYGRVVLWNALFGLFLEAVVLALYSVFRNSSVRLVFVCFALIIWNSYGFAVAILSNYD